MFLISGTFKNKFLVYYFILLSSLAGLVRNFGSISVGGQSFTFAGLVWLLSFVYLLFILVAQISKIKVFKYDKYIFIFSFFAFFSTLLNSSHIVSSIQELVFYLFPFVLLFFIRTNFKFTEISNQLKIMYFTPFLGWCILSLLLMIGLVEYTSNGPKGIYSSRPLVLFLLIVISFSVANYRYEKSKSNRIALLMSISLILFSLSRTASFLCLILCAFLYLNPRRLLRSFSYVSGFSVFCILLLLQIPSIESRFFYNVPTDYSNLDEVGTQINTSGRDKLWVATFEKSLESPFFGHGGSAARNMLADVSTKPGLEKEHPHNEFLQLFYDFGIIAAICYYLYFLSVIKRAYFVWKYAHRNKNNKLAAYSLATFLAGVSVVATSLTDNTFHYLFVLTPFTFILAAFELLLREQYD